MKNSLGYSKIAIPRPLMEGLGLIPGESLKIERIEDKIVMTPVVQTRPRVGTPEAQTTPVIRSYPDE